MTADSFNPLTEEEVKPGRALDALVAENVMGHRTSSWSLHLVNCLEDLPAEKEWRHGLFSGHDMHTGRFPTEILVADANGDMPTVEFWDGRQWDIVPAYSTDIAAAWEVVEKLAPHYIQQAFSRNEIGWEIDWCVSEEAYRKGYRTVVDYAEDYKTQSLPLAICLASLRAVRGEK